MALGILIVLGIVVTSVVSYTTSNTRSTSMSSGRLTARSASESAINTVVGTLEQQIIGGADPAAANLLGCAGATGPGDTNGPSNCSSPAPRLLCLNGGSTCTAGEARTATVFGYYSGTNGGTYNGISVPAATWLLVSTGYASDPAIGGVTSHETQAEIKVNPLNSGSVASVWNHVFVTSPLVAGQCSLDFSGNNIAANVPIYVIGNFCLGGSSIDQSTLPIDVMVGGYLYLNGGHVGSSATPITSGVVVGGCTASKTGSSPSACATGGWNWHVGTTDTFIPRDAPEETVSDIQHDYSTFNLGPAHPCAAGNNPYAPLASTVFESSGNTTYDNSAGTWNLTPGASYTCNSTSGPTVGQLQWDNGSKVLTITGSVFIDGNLTINQSLTYTGTGIIEVAGTITLSGNGLHVCAVSNCSFTNWQGTTGNNQMLTLASLASNTTAVTFLNNSQTFQGSLWTQPSSSLTFVKNGDSLQGPMSIGSFDATFNNATLQPLPVIKNMPVGAPVPPNTGATLGTLQYLN
jgi:hypothetical protein